MKYQTPEVIALASAMDAIQSTDKGTSLANHFRQVDR
jgi:hypothetical protein